MAFSLLSIATVRGEHPVSIEEMAAAHDATLEAVRYSVGELEVSRSDRSSLDLGVDAARACLAKARVAPSEVSCIIWCGGTPERVSGPMMQEALGIEDAFALTVVAGCAAVPVALRNARGLVAEGSVDKVLVVFGERWSARVQPLAFPGADRFSETRRTHVFSDAGGAALVGVGERMVLEGFGFANLGKYTGWCAGRDAPIDPMMFVYDELPMQRVALERCLASAGIGPDRIDRVLLPNVAPILRESWMKRLRLPGHLLYTPQPMPSHLGNGDGLHALEALEADDAPARILYCATSLGAMRCAIIRR